MPVYKDKQRGTWYISTSYTPKKGFYKKKTVRGFKKKSDALNYERVIMIQLKQKAKYNFVLGLKLEDATQVVYPKDKPNEIFETWVSTKEPHIIKGLEVGQTYIWEEISAPYGFALAEKIEFTVEDTGEIQVAGTMKDEIVYGQLAFEKVGKQFTYTDIGMTDLGVVNTPVFEEMNILGAEITIYASEDITLGNGITYYKADEEIETLVSDFEAVQSIKLPVGKYYYVETKAPIGFVKNEEKHYFEVKDNQINELQVIESTLNVDCLIN